MRETISDTMVSRRATLGGLAAIGAGALAGALAASPAFSQGLTKVTFGTDWLAQAEHGGFYQAVATGLYAKAGLDVTIRQGGPQANVAQNIAAGVVDFQMSSEAFFPLNFVQEKIPVTTVAAFFQKNPRVLISHPGQGHDTLEQIKGKPVLISASARTGYWAWLKARYGYTDDQVRPYTFNMGPFLADKKAIQQGFITSEPYSIEQEGKFKPHLILIADHGFESYSTMVHAQVKTIRERPKLVQAFIDASIEGWYSYMYGDPKPGNDLILKENREMTADRLANSIAMMKQYGIVDSGDSLNLGIGAMTEARWGAFVDSIKDTGLYPANIDWKQAFTLEFVNKRHAIQMRK
jgi:NitT/TauT family transport system substrate-binding protein